MSSAPIVIVATIFALVTIYFLPRLGALLRKIRGRYRRHQRTLRQERDRRAQSARRA